MAGGSASPSIRPEQFDPELTAEGLMAEGRRGGRGYSILDFRIAISYFFRRGTVEGLLYGTNVTCECLQNKLALMGRSP